MAMIDYWEIRRRYIENGAKFGGVAGMKAAERSWNAGLRRTLPPRPELCENCGIGVDPEDPLTKKVEHEERTLYYCGGRCLEIHSLYLQALASAGILRKTK